MSHPNIVFDRKRQLEYEKRMAPTAHAPNLTRMRLGDDMTETEKWDRECDTYDERYAQKFIPKPPLDADDPILLPAEQPPHWVYGMSKKKKKEEKQRRM